MADLRTLTGTLSSFRIAMAPVAVWTRARYRHQNTRDWGVVLDAEAVEELGFWRERL